MRKMNSTALTDGLTICLDKMTKMDNESAIREYLSFGNKDDMDIKEEVARLLLLATTKPSDNSPIVDISKKIMDDHVVDINSIFLREFLEIKERNKSNSFMKTEFYKCISNLVDEIELKNSCDSGFYLNDGIVLVNNIRNLYKFNLDNKINDDVLDVRYREPLLELFQNYLDCTLDSLVEGVNKNVQLQTKH